MAQATTSIKTGAPEAVQASTSTRGPRPPASSAATEPTEAQQAASRRAERRRRIERRGGAPGRKARDRARDFYTRVFIAFFVLTMVCMLVLAGYAMAA